MKMLILIYEGGLDLARCWGEAWVILSTAWLVRQCTSLDTGIVEWLFLFFSKRDLFTTGPWLWRSIYIWAHLVRDARPEIELGCDISYMWKEAKFIDTEDITIHHNHTMLYPSSASQLLCGNSVNTCELSLCPSKSIHLKKSTANIRNTLLKSRIIRFTLANIWNTLRVPFFKKGISSLYSFIKLT